MTDKIQELEEKKNQLAEEFNTRFRELEIEIGKLKMKSDKPKPIRWMPGHSVVYYYLDNNGTNMAGVWTDTAIDHHRRNHLGIFHTAEDRARWYRIDAVIREECGEPVEGDDISCLQGDMDGQRFVVQECYYHGPRAKYWTNDPQAADRINARLSEDDRRWFLTGGRG